jgi:phosphoglycolate phosphatase-like HAD superfamily hydrolase
MTAIEAVVFDVDGTLLDTMTAIPAPYADTILAGLLAPHPSG